MSVLLGREVSELAWFGAKLPTCFGGLGRGFAAQAPHPEIAAALAAKTYLLLSGVAVDKNARVTNALNSPLGLGAWASAVDLHLA